ncbi:hypothetical protein [Chitiniphilus shinanonensis]|uniref:hypothetical protein n=1 Tax=Chitiniphilus shinanonensis TaxID=553088 RepID=UPI0012FBF096|nr:hypothetical protein [Chitiniphilus shinanonensis]
MKKPLGMKHLANRQRHVVMDSVDSNSFFARNIFACAKMSDWVCRSDGRQGMPA